ncbi:hypothetical protein [Sphingomonas rubra]|nr:hypothetical protein [Sphingomonas rubra]
MVFARAALTTATTSMVGVVAANPRAASSYQWVSDMMPMLVGVIMCVIVRALIDMDSKKKRGWNYNLLVMVLCSVFTAVMVHEYALSSGGAMMLGVGSGATGVGLINYGKPVLAALVDKLNDSVNGTSK